MPMINTQIEMTKQRKHFHRDYYKKGLSVLIVLLVVELLCTLFITYYATHREIPAFYASSSDGISTKLKAMREPNRSNKALME